MAHSRFSILFAFLLPPQIQISEFDWEKQGRELAVEKARSHEVLSQAPLFHRGLFWSPQKQLRIPDANTGEWLEFNPLSLQIRSLSKKWRVEDLQSPSVTSILEAAGLRFKSSEEGRSLELLDPKDSSKNLWRMDLPIDTPVEWTSDGHDFILGLSRQSRSFFVLHPRNLKFVRRLNWDSSVEIVDLLSCPARVQLLIEQVPKFGLTRIVRLRDAKPVSYTVFDLSRGSKKSDLTQALTLNCMDIFVAGPYGLQRIRY